MYWGEVVQIVLIENSFNAILFIGIVSIILGILTIIIIDSLER
jgi:uncharacterized membrane protein